MQWKALHSGSPYAEDYYFLAALCKATGGRTARSFAPDALRALAPHARAGSEPAAYVQLQGLGKIAHSSLRRPKPLMDLDVGGSRAAPKAGGDDGDAGPTRALADEPRLAARIVVEDCACLLLDVADIDRLFAAAGGRRPDEGALQQRRAVLLEALCTSLRVADGVAAPPSADAVFRILVGLHKGRSVLAAALLALASPLACPPAGGPPLKLLWAVLRCAGDIWAEPPPPPADADLATATEREKAELDASSAVAAAVVKLAGRLHDGRAVASCLDALTKGGLGERAAAAESPADALLPLAPPGDDGAEGGAAGDAQLPPRIWLGDALAALLGRATTLGLSAASTGPDADAWRTSFGSFFALLCGHVGTLLEVCKLANAAGADTAADYARRIVPFALIRAALPHADVEARDGVRAKLDELAK